MTKKYPNETRWGVVWFYISYWLHRIHCSHKSRAYYTNPNFSYERRILDWSWCLICGKRFGWPSVTDEEARK